MAITGTFLADFDDFYSAVLESQRHLQALTERAATVGQSFDAMSSSLDPGAVEDDALAMRAAIDTAAASATAASTSLAGVSGAIEATAAAMTGAMAGAGETSSAAVEGFVLESQRHLQTLPEQAGLVGASFVSMSAALDPGMVAEDALSMKTSIDTAGEAAATATTSLDGVSVAMEATGKRMAAAGESGGKAIGGFAEQTKQLPPAVGLGSVAVEVFDSKIGSMVGKFAGPQGMLSLFETGIGILTDFAKGMIDTADEVSDLSTKFQISTDAVQQFKFIGEATDTSLATLAGSARNIAINVAEGDTSTVAALTRLGLTMDDLRGKSPDEMMFTVSRALAEVKDAGTQASIAMDLGGKKMVESLGAVNSGMDDLRTKAPVMHADVVSSIDGLVESGSNWAAQQKVDLQNTVGLWAILIDKGPMATMAAYEQMHTVAAPKLDDMAGKIKEATVLEEAHNNAIKTKTLSLEEYGRIEQELTTSALASIEVNKETARHDKEVLAVRERLFSTDVIDKANVYVEALGSASRVATMTKDQQVALNDAVMKGIDAYVAAGAAVPAEMLKVANATRQGVDPLLDTLSNLIPVTASFSAASSLAWDTYKATVEDSTAAINAAVGASAEFQLAKILAMGGTTRESLQATADKHRETYEFALLHADNFTAAQIENFRILAESGQAAAESWGTSFVENLAEVNSAADTTRGKIEEVAAAATNSKASIEASFSLPNVNPVTGEGMAGTDPRVKGYLMSGYTLSEAISLAQGTGSGIMGPKGTWTAEGYKYGITGDIFSKATFDTRGVSAIGGGGSTYQTTVNVGGSVIAEKDLIDTIQRGMLDGARGSGTRLPARA